MNTNHSTSEKTRRLDFGITFAFIVVTTLAFSNPTRTQQLSQSSQPQTTNAVELVTLK